MPLTDLLHFLARLLAIENYPPDEQGGIFNPTVTNLPDYHVNRIGLALEPKPGLANWVARDRIDALWLHRPWHLDQYPLTANIPVFYHHLPFDEYLTIGYNPRLANALDLAEPLEVLGTKQATDFQVRPIGMIGDAKELYFDGWRTQITDQFGGYDEAIPGRRNLIGKVAIVGAMTDALVREAAGRGVGLYITGQNRKPAQQALEETGLGLIAIGHRRSEEWGLRVLAEMLRQQTPLDVSLME